MPVICDVVLGIAFFKLTSGVEQKEFVLAIGGFILVQEQNDAWRSGVVKQIFGQVNHAFNQVIIHKPFAHLLLFGRVGAADAPTRRARIQHNGGARRESFRLARTC